MTVNRQELLKSLCQALALLLVWGAMPALAKTEPRPNIIIILADDMGWGDPACNNPDSKIKTPAIDQIAREGIRFTDAHAPASWCTPTRYGLMTGRYPFRTNLTWRNRPVIEADRLTLPAMLREHGYRTSMVGKWHLGFDIEGGDRSKRHQGGPIDRGFDRYFGIPSSLDIPPFYYLEGDLPVAAPTGRVEAKNTPGWSPIQGEFWRAGGMAPGFQHLEVLPTLTKRAEQEIFDHHLKHGEQPLFMYMPLPAPHTPWVPTPEFVGKSAVPLYGDFVQQVDATVGRILKALEETGMRENTLLIFSSDNGPVWYAADEVKYEHRATSRYRGMKGDAWEGGHRMPLVMRWPEQCNAGQVSDRLVCLTDVFATCAAIVGHALPENAAEDSFDISNLVQNKHANPSVTKPKQVVPQRTDLIVNSTGKFLMVRDGEWKLIPFRGSGGFSVPKHVTNVPAGEPQGQLYNLRVDPYETNNVYSQQPEVVAKLTKRLADLQANGRSR